MTRLLARARRPAALACVFALSFTLLPATLWASDDAPANRDTTLRAAIERAATVEHQRLEQRRVPGAPAAPSAAQSQTTSDPDLRSGSFFRSPVGVAVLAAFGVGFGYALYSASNDRIRSSGR